MAICGVLCLLNLVVGVSVLWRYRWASFLGAVNLAFQIPAVNSSLVVYSYIGVGDLFAMAKIDPSTSTYLFGASAAFSPGTFSVFVNTSFPGVELYFGVLATILAIILLQDYWPSKTRGIDTPVVLR
jgi:hypothetical protein